MSDVKRNQIVDFTVTAENVSSLGTSVTADEVVPMLVVAVADDGKSYSGYIFPPDGTPRYTTFSEAPPVAPEPIFDAQTGKRLRDEQPVYDAQTGRKLADESPLFDVYTDAPIPQNTTPTQPVAPPTAPIESVPAPVSTPAAPTDPQHTQPDTSPTVITPPNPVTSPSVSSEPAHVSNPLTGV